MMGLLLLTGVCLRGADPPAYQLQIDKKVHAIKCSPASGGELLSLKQIARAFGFPFYEDRGGKHFDLVIRDTRISFRSDSRWVTAEKYRKKLSRKARLQDHDFFVPPDALVEIIGSFYGENITFEPSSRRFTVGGREAAEEAMKESAFRALLSGGRAKDQTFTVVIDPGHGGEEIGAIGSNGTLEKEITLQIAKKLKTAVEKNGDVKAFLTRHSDIYLPLEKRAEIANNQGGDLFISIHTNASKARSARGAETYFMSLEATDQEAELLAEKENVDNRNTPPFSEEKSDLQLILWDMAQSAYLNESAKLAEMIQSHLNEQINLENRGIKQAPFVVLMGVAMPAVMVEVAFITNPDEEAKLRTNHFQNKAVDALAESIAQFIAGDRLH